MIPYLHVRQQQPTAAHGALSAQTGGRAMPLMRTAQHTASAVNAAEGPHPTISSPSFNGFLPALASLQSALQGVAGDAQRPALVSSAAAVLAPVTSITRSSPTLSTTSRPRLGTTSSTSSTSSLTVATELSPAISANASSDSTASALVKPAIITGAIVGLLVLGALAFHVWRKTVRHRLVATTPMFSPLFGPKTPPNFRDDEKQAGRESWQKFEESQTSLPASLSAARDFAPPAATQGYKTALGKSRPYSAMPPSALLAQSVAPSATVNSLGKTVKKQEIGRPQPTGAIGLGFDPNTTSAALALGHYSIQVPTKPAPMPNLNTMPKVTMRSTNEKTMSVAMTGVGAGVTGQIQIQQANVVRQASIKNSKPLLARKPSTTAAPAGYKFLQPVDLARRLSALGRGIPASTSIPDALPSRSQPAIPSSAQNTAALVRPHLPFVHANTGGLRQDKDKALSRALGFATPTGSPALDLDLYRYTRYDDNYQPGRLSLAASALYTPSVRHSLAPTRLSVVSSTATPSMTFAQPTLIQLPLPTFALEVEGSPNTELSLGKLMLESEGTPRIIVEELTKPLSMSHQRGLSLSASQSRFDSDSDDDDVVAKVASLEPVRKPEPVVSHRRQPTKDRLIRKPSLEQRTQIPMPQQKPTLERRPLSEAKVPRLGLPVPIASASTSGASSYANSASSPALPYLTQDDGEPESSSLLSSAGTLLDSAPPSVSFASTAPPPSRIPVPKTTCGAGGGTKPLNLEPKVGKVARLAKRVSMLPRLDFPLPPVTLPQRSKAS